jgi:hypothetical protein
MGHVEKGTVTSSTTSTEPTQVDTVTAMTASPNPSTLGQAVRLLATVTLADNGGPIGFRSRPQQVFGPDGGTLTISDGDTVPATVAVEEGQAAFTTSSLSIGTHTITAAFSGTPPQHRAASRSSTGRPTSQPPCQQSAEPPTRRRLAHTARGESCRRALPRDRVAPGLAQVRHDAPVLGDQHPGAGGLPTISRRSMDRKASRSRTERPTGSYR